MVAVLAVVVVVAMLARWRGPSVPSGDGLVSVIVQARPGGLQVAAREVERFGGRLGRRLRVINGFTARVPAGQVGRLQGSLAVASVTGNEPVAMQAAAYAPTTDAGSLDTTPGHRGPGLLEGRLDRQGHRCGRDRHRHRPVPGWPARASWSMVPTCRLRPRPPPALSGHRRARRPLHDPGWGGPDQPGPRPLRPRGRGQRHQKTLATSDDAVASFSSSGSGGTGGTKNPDLVAPVPPADQPGRPRQLHRPDLRRRRGRGRRPDAGQRDQPGTAVRSGAAALVLQQHPTWTNNQVKALLTSTARPLWAGTLTPSAQGKGTLDLAKGPLGHHGGRRLQLHQLQRRRQPGGGRGSPHLVDNGVVLNGEKDIVGDPVSTSTWPPGGPPGRPGPGDLKRPHVVGLQLHRHHLDGHHLDGPDVVGPDVVQRGWSGRMWSGPMWSAGT